MSAAQIAAPAADPLPIQVIGVLPRDGMDHYWFRLADGTTAAVTFAQLVTRPVLVALFGGQERWLRQNFPGQFVVVANREGGGRRVSTGIDLVAAARHLARMCVEAEAEAEAEAQAKLAAITSRRGWWRRMLDAAGDMTAFWAVLP